MTRPPSLFVSHGAPTIAIADSPARRFLTQMADGLAKPTAILVVSAHWETAAPAVSVAERPETIHDFYGFPDALYRLRYDALGAPALAERAAALLEDAGLGPVAWEARGLDHGAWVPLLLAYPEADIPVAQLSVQPDAGPEHHFRVGEALATLRDDGVLILGSGSLTHDLASFDKSAPDGPAPDWVRAFDQWMSWAVVEGRGDDLLDYRRLAPHAERNHPTEEHILPLFVALGAGDPAAPGRHLHASHSHAVLAMDAYAWA